MKKLFFTLTLLTSVLFTNLVVGMEPIFLDDIKIEFCETSPYIKASFVITDQDSNERISQRLVRVYNDLKKNPVINVVFKRFEKPKAAIEKTTEQGFWKLIKEIASIKNIEKLTINDCYEEFEERLLKTFASDGADSIKKIKIICSSSPGLSRFKEFKNLVSLKLHSRLDMRATVCKGSSFYKLEELKELGQIKRLSIIRDSGAFFWISVKKTLPFIPKQISDIRFNQKITPKTLVTAINKLKSLKIFAAKIESSKDDDFYKKLKELLPESIIGLTIDKKHQRVVFSIGLKNNRIVCLIAPINDQTQGGKL